MLCRTNQATTAAALLAAARQRLPFFFLPLGAACLPPLLEAAGVGISALACAAASAAAAAAFASRALFERLGCFGISSATLMKSTVPARNRGGGGGGTP